MPAPCPVPCCCLLVSSLPQDPCSSLVLRDAICPSCQDCQDLDLCRDPAVSQPAGAVQPLCSASLWQCTVQFTAQRASRAFELAQHYCTALLLFRSVGSPYLHACLLAYTCTS
jgi:hypothetical protein